MGEPWSPSLASADFFSVKKEVAQAVSQWTTPAVSQWTTPAMSEWTTPAESETTTQAMSEWRTERRNPAMSEWTGFTRVEGTDLTCLPGGGSTLLQGSYGSLDAKEAPSSSSSSCSSSSSSSSSSASSSSSSPTSTCSYEDEGVYAIFRRCGRGPKHEYAFDFTLPGALLPRGPRESAAVSTRSSSPHLSTGGTSCTSSARSWSTTSLNGRAGEGEASGVVHDASCVVQDAFLPLEKSDYEDGEDRPIDRSAFLAAYAQLPEDKKRQLWTRVSLDVETSSIFASMPALEKPDADSPPFSSSLTLLPMSTSLSSSLPDDRKLSLLLPAAAVAGAPPHPSTPEGSEDGTSSMSDDITSLMARHRLDGDGAARVFACYSPSRRHSYACGDQKKSKLPLPDAAPLHRRSLSMGSTDSARGSTEPTWVTPMGMGVVPPQFPGVVTPQFPGVVPQTAHYSVPSYTAPHSVPYTVQHTVRSMVPRVIASNDGRIIGYDRHIPTLNGTASSNKGAKRFFCPDCGKSFTQKNGLINHARIHTGDRPFHCSECPGRFTQKTNLKRHIRDVHRGAKSFPCPCCPKRFKRKCGLSVHVRKHKEREYDPFHYVKDY